MTSSKDAKPWYREPFVWMVILIPATAVVMGAVMITLAVSSQDGLVVDDYYRRGLEINKVIERDEAAAAYRLEADLVLDASTGVVRATLVGSDAFVRPSMLRLALMHPTRSGLDQELFLKRLDIGTYQDDLRGLPPGHWHVQIEADDWRLTGRIRVPNEQRVLLLNRAPRGETDAANVDV